MDIDDNSKIRELISRALPANDNSNQPSTTAKAVPYAKSVNYGISIVGSNNIVIEANLLILTTYVILLIMINLWLGQ